MAKRKTNKNHLPVNSDDASLSKLKTDISDLQTALNEQKRLNWTHLKTNVDGYFTELGQYYTNAKKCAKRQRQLWYNDVENQRIIFSRDLGNAYSAKNREKFQLNPKTSHTPSTKSETSSIIGKGREYGNRISCANRENIQKKINNRRSFNSEEDEEMNHDAGWLEKFRNPNSSFEFGNYYNNVNKILKMENEIEEMMANYGKKVFMNEYFDLVRECWTFERHNKYVAKFAHERMERVECHFNQIYMERKEMEAEQKNNNESLSRGLEKISKIDRIIFKSIDEMTEEQNKDLNEKRILQENVSFAAENDEKSTTNLNESSTNIIDGFNLNQRKSVISNKNNDIKLKSEASSAAINSNNLDVKPHKNVFILNGNNDVKKEKKVSVSNSNQFELNQNTEVIAPNVNDQKQFESESVISKNITSISNYLIHEILEEDKTIDDKLIEKNIQTLNDNLNDSKDEILAEISNSNSSNCENSPCEELPNAITSTMNFLPNTPPANDIEIAKADDDEMKLLYFGKPPIEPQASCSFSSDDNNFDSSLKFLQIRDKFNNSN